MSGAPSPFDEHTRMWADEIRGSDAQCRAAEVVRAAYEDVLESTDATIDGPQYVAAALAAEHLLTDGDHDWRTIADELARAYRWVCTNHPQVPIEHLPLIRYDEHRRSVDG